MKLIRITTLVLVMSISSIFASAQDAKSNNMDAYKASFKMEENQYIKTMTIDVKDGKLVAISDARPGEPIELTKTAKVDTFEAKVQNYEATFIFGRTKEGDIKTLKLSIAGGMFVLSGEKEVSEYASTFDMAENQYCKKIFIKEKGGKLFMAADTNPAEMVELTSKSADVFTASVQSYDAEISFSRKEGKVTSIKISVGSGQVVLTGEKSPQS